MTQSYSWPDNARLALSLVVNVEEGAEMMVRDGDKGPEPVDELQAAPRSPVRAYSNESNYQYGIKAGAPRVLRLLDDRDIHATWTSAALALERAPELARAIAARGDEVCSHGYRWILQFSMDEAEERDFIRKAWQSIEKSTGTRPYGWLSRYLFSDNTRRLLLEEGYTYHMDDFSDDAPFWTSVEMADGASKPMVITPYALDTNDMKMWLTPAATPADWLQYAKDTFDVLYAEGADAPRMMSLGVHLRIIGRPGRIGALAQFLDYARSKPGVWFATRGQIAQHFAQASPAPAA